MAQLSYIEVTLLELAQAEKAALRAQEELRKLITLGAATGADRARFDEIATQLYGIEMALYTQITNALSSLPSALTSQLPAPTKLTVPNAGRGLGAIQIPIGVVWALVALAVLLALVAAVAVAYTISITIDTISQIILTYRAAQSYGDALQQRVQVINACVAAGRTAAECAAAAQAIILPAPVQPPPPPIPPNPNTPWYMAASVVGGLGALALGFWFLERRGDKRALGGSVIDLREDADDGGLSV